MRRWQTFGLALLCWGMSPSAFAGLELSTDHRPLFFGLMQIDEEKTLAESGSYHNEVVCSSTNGNSWYVKINVLQPLSSGSEMIPLDAFTWQLTSTNGTGTPTSPSQWKAFSLMPDLVYISGPNEAAGQSVRLQFSYALKIPDTQVRGLYQTTIRLTLTEML